MPPSLSLQNDDWVQQGNPNDCICKFMWQQLVQPRWIPKLMVSRTCFNTTPALFPSKLKLVGKLKKCSGKAAAEKLQIRTGLVSPWSQHPKDLQSKKDSHGNWCWNQWDTCLRPVHHDEQVLCHGCGMQSCKIHTTCTAVPWVWKINKHAKVWLPSHPAISCAWYQAILIMSTSVVPTPCRYHGTVTPSFTSTWSMAGQKERNNPQVLVICMNMLCFQIYLSLSLCLSICYLQLSMSYNWAPTLYSLAMSPGHRCWGNTTLFT